jgi:microcystin-dependent protein
VANPFLGEVRSFGFNYAPKGWALCNGQILPINQNTALFALLGTTYGGNGVSTFQLPNLQGRVPMHRSLNGTYQQGTIAGTEQVTITQSTMPLHNHLLVGTTSTGDAKIPASVLGVSASATDYYYALPTSPVMLNQGSISPAGSGQGHPNLQPYLVINYCIALMGVFPSRG